MYVLCLPGSGDIHACAALKHVLQSIPEPEHITGMTIVHVHMPITLEKYLLDGLYLRPLSVRP